ncbi:MAG: lipoprotein-releasing protein [Bdellovibrio sp. 28-41-41]|nr:MAG: lipoprotein-releasing protein [Bdellovibrio sp. 28-41-41]
MKNPLVFIAWKLLFTRKFILEGSTPLSLLGLVLGVACLLVSMAVMSGFEATLKKTMTDVTGHIQVIDKNKSKLYWKDFENELKTIEPKLESTTRFVYIESVLASKGQIVGILLQGIDSDRYKNIINLNQRLVEGANDISVVMEGKVKVPQAMIGKGIARRLNIKVGDKINVVVPISDSVDPSIFKPQAAEFRVSGILDLGKYEWNERLIITDIASAQKVASIGDRYTGLIMKLSDDSDVRGSAFRIAQKLGPQYLIRDWRDVNENLFDAVEIERVVIFFVILIIVIVAAFNISSTLYVGVVQRNGDIAILKTLGVSKKQILKIFTLQGIFLGLMGVALGLVLGFILCQGFMVLQNQFELIPGSVYKIDNIEIKIRTIDVFAITLATLVISFFATLAPALRSSRLSVVEGLRYG